MRNLIGWDIGGAHLKAVQLDADGVAQHAIQLACPLWRGTHELVEAIKRMMLLLGLNQQASVCHAVTMTGELVDLFPNRRAGVLQIARIAHTHLGEHVSFYATENGFVAYTQVAQYALEIASMNWHASANYVARHICNGLLIDIGSTTTDIIPIYQHAVEMPWRTDAERMSHHALVYTGVVRTPLMALAQTIDFQSLQYHVAAEHFATTADVHRLLGLLSTSDDDAETADGKDKSASSSARRVARMIGHDLDDASMTAWLELASQFKEAQIRLLSQAIVSQNLYHHGLIGMGVGSFLVKMLAAKLNVPYHDVGNWIKSNNTATQSAANVCFPAYAVAQLIHHAS